MTATVSADILLYLLDKEYNSTLSRLKESGDLPGLAIALSYGCGLEAGREFGTREQRRNWILSQRAERVRKIACDIVIGLNLERSQLRSFLLTVRKQRGYGPLLKRIMRSCVSFAGGCKPDPDYVCGAAYCDDPACNEHGASGVIE